MKKIVFLIAVCLFVTACGNTNFKEATREVKKMSQFSNNEELKKEDIEYRFDIDTSHFADTFVYYFNSKDNSNFIMIIKPLDQEGIDAYKQIKDFYESEWLDIVYEEEEAKKVENHLEVRTNNGYYIYIVSNDNQKVYEKIKDKL